MTLHVVLVPLALCRPRVDDRVATGGHAVPPDKIRARYHRLWPLVAEARAVADRTSFYDNSRADRPFRTVARYERAQLVGQATWPRWTPAPVM